MAINKEKITANAMKHLQKGHLDKAVKEFEKILELEPEDERTLQKVGDLYSRLGQTQAALNAYQRVYQIYMREGFVQKAIAVIKQILVMDSSQMELHGKLAEMYHQLGLLSETIQQYQILVKFYEDNGRAKDVLETLRRITIIDPGNLPNRIKLAEGLILDNYLDDGLQEYEKLLADLERSKREDDYVRVLDRLVFHAPEMIDRGRELARIYLDRGETKKGLMRLKLVLKEDSESLETLSLLARAFQSLNQLSKTITVYREMARIYKDSNDISELKATYEKILEIDPMNQDAIQGVEEIPFETGVPGDMLSVNDGESMLEEVHSLSQHAPQNAFTDPSDELETDSAEFIKMMTEAEVFVKYGLHDQAFDRLTVILDIEPDNIEALGYMKEVYFAIEENEEAEKILLKIAKLRLEQNDTFDGRAALDEALQLQINTSIIEDFIAKMDQTPDAELAVQISEYLGEDAGSSDEDLPEDISDAAEEEEELADKDMPANVSDLPDDILVGRSDSEIDFDQEAEIEVDELEILPDSDEMTDVEPEILEEVELPKHMIASDDDQDSLDDVSEMPMLKSQAKPPMLPEKQDIEIEEDFGDGDVDELLINETLGEDDLSGRKPHELKRRSESAEEDFSLDDEPMIEMDQSDLLKENEISETSDEATKDEDDSFEMILDLDDIEEDEQTDDEPIESEPAELTTEELEEDELLFDDDIEIDDEFEILEEDAEQETEQEAEEAVDVEPDSIDLPLDIPVTDDLSESDLVSESDMDLSALESFEAPDDLRSDRSDEPKQGASIPAIDIEEFAAKPEMEETQIEEVGEIEAEFEEAYPQDEIQEIEKIDDNADAANGDAASADDANRGDAEIAAELLAEEDQAEQIESVTQFEEIEVDDLEILSDADEEFEDDSEVLDADDVEPQDIEYEDVDPAELMADEIISDEAEDFNLETGLPDTGLQQNPDFELILAVLSEKELDDFEEGQFFYQQGIWSECIPLFDALLLSHQGNQELITLIELCNTNLQADEDRKKAQLNNTSIADDVAKTVFMGQGAFDMGNEESTHIKPDSAGSPESGMINLSEEILSDLDDAQQESSTKIAETIGDEDIDTHYNLGLAYKEMGLLDEAIGEFRVALKGGASIKTSYMAAICYLDKNLNKKAAEFMRKAITSPKMTRTRFLKMRYDLVLYYLAKNADAKAFAELTYLKEANAKFADIEELFAKLLAKDIQTAKPDKLSKLLNSVNFDKLV